MKSSVVKYFIIGISIGLTISCGKDNNDGAQTPVPTEAKTPAASAALSPAPNAVCQGEEISETEVSVTIKSAKVDEATSYIYKVFKNDGSLLGTETETVPQTTVVLEKSKAYSYTVTSKNANGETAGNPVSFTTPGISMANYVPVVTEVVFDIANDSVGLLFFDNDGDALVYTAKLADNSDFDGEAVLASNASATATGGTTLTEVGLVTGSVNWLKIILEDSHGNRSITIRSYLE